LLLPLELGGGIFEQAQPLLQSFDEALLLDANDIANALFFGAQFGISIAHDCGDGFRHFMQKRFF